MKNFTSLLLSHFSTFPKIAMVLLTFAAMLFSGKVHAQSLQAWNGPQARITPRFLAPNHPLNMGNGDNPEPRYNTLLCGQDTIRYPLEKAFQGTRSLSVNTATSAQGLAQYFDAPQEITLYGFEFFGYTPNNDPRINITCELWRAGPDSLPIDTALVSVVVPVDSFFGTLSLDDLRRVAMFPQPIVVDFPYLLVVKNLNAQNLIMLTNDWDTAGGAVPDGAGEWLMSGDFGNLGGSWTRSYNMNIGGLVANSDALLHPFVSYDLLAAFVVDKTCLTAGDTVFVTNMSSPVAFNRMYNQAVATGAGAFSHRWDFGDGGGIVNGANPAHKYFGTGPYNLVYELLLGNYTLICSLKDSILIDGNPVSDFIYTTNGAWVDFTNLSSGADSTWWEFGDGGTSNLTDPLHLYANGSYQVLLITQNACGFDTLADSIFIQCNDPHPIANFGWNQFFFNITFSDSSTDATSWHWDFGDGSTSLLRNPNHTYVSSNMYIVTLIVTNRCGSDTISQVVYAGPPLAIVPGPEKLQAEIWPNPASNRIFISVPDPNNPIQVTLYDLSGRVLGNWEPGVEEALNSGLSLEHINPGLYLIRLTSEENEFISKLILNPE